MERRIFEADAFLRELDSNPILIKGWLAARNYDHPEERGYTDIDFIIAPEKYEKALSILDTFKGKISVDLHKGARHLDTVSYENLYENSRLIKCGENFIRVPRPEDHLRILCVHWLNDGGARKDRLADIYYAVKNRPKDFDWNRCLDSVSAKRRRWIICAIGLAQKHLGLDLAETFLANEKIVIPKWLDKALEKEWQSETPLIPLQNCLNDRRRLFEQIKKRIPPNAIQATIEMDGEFDNTPRVFYQIGDIFLRLVPSFKRIFSGVLRDLNLKKRKTER